VSTCPTYVISPAIPRIDEYRFYKLVAQRGDPVQLIPFNEGDSVDRIAVDNRAPYGAIIHVRLPFRNECANPITVRYFLEGWGGPGTRYSGAIAMRGGRWRLPLLPWRTAANLGIEAIPPGTYTFEMDLAVAGASSAPARFGVRRES
jgi:hypothetical protein